MISRRKFVKSSLQAASASLLLPAFNSCESKPSFPGSMLGPNARLGHMLRDMKFESPKETQTIDIVIVGGGASGLSAARYLKKFTNEFILLELGDEPGGNAIGGSNAVSAYPWGAHYLPLPGDNDAELTAFLQESGVITGYESGLPVYNEYYLCFDPKERLFINNYWQEGLVPREGIPQKDYKEIERFLDMMHTFRNQKGSDGLFAFAIPVDYSSRDKALLSLDAVSMERFLHDNNFTSTYLKWYVNYCCADDYGSSISNTSAWAGIHYFASRRGKAMNASDTVLTWPEGNHWLIKQLSGRVKDNIHTKGLVYKVELQKDTVEVSYYDDEASVTKKIIARKCILATPQFINQRILSTGNRESFSNDAFQYAPWIVANITLDAPLSERHGELLCWDNVIYGSDALGYVNANHQQVGIQGDKKVITYYKPLLGDDIKQARQSARERSHDVWKDLILSDLKKPHPKIEERIKHMDTWAWGHGMVRPAPGFMWGNDRKNASLPIDNKIFFAHSDLSGISIFEEAFYNGHSAARSVLKSL